MPQKLTTPDLPMGTQALRMWFEKRARTIVSMRAILCRPRPAVPGTPAHVEIYEARSVYGPPMAGEQVGGPWQDVGVRIKLTEAELGAAQNMSAGGAGLEVGRKASGLLKL